VTASDLIAPRAHLRTPSRPVPRPGFALTRPGPDIVGLGPVARRRQRGRCQRGGAAAQSHSRSGYRDTLYKLHRASIKADLGTGKSLQHLDIEDVSDEQTDAVLDEE
jgi:hypothetical protein